MWAFVGVSGTVMFTHNNHDTKLLQLGLCDCRTTRVITCVRPCLHGDMENEHITWIVKRTNRRKKTNLKISARKEAQFKRTRLCLLVAAPTKAVWKNATHTHENMDTRTHRHTDTCTQCAAFTLATHLKSFHDDRVSNVGGARLHGLPELFLGVVTVHGENFKEAICCNVKWHVGVCQWSSRWTLQMNGWFFQNFIWNLIVDFSYL